MENAIQKAIEKELELEEPTFELMPVADSRNDDQYDGGFHIARRAAPRPGFVDRATGKRSSSQAFTFD